MGKCHKQQGTHNYNSSYKICFYNMFEKWMLFYAFEQNNMYIFLYYTLYNTYIVTVYGRKQGTEMT